MTSNQATNLLFSLPRSDEDRLRRKLERLEHRKIYVSQKIHLLRRMLIRNASNPETCCLIQEQLDKNILRYKLIWRLICFCMKNPNAHYLTLSTRHFRSYNESFIRAQFITVLQRICNQLFGRKAEWDLSGFAVVEKHDKKGDPVCPHIHALISFPDEIIEWFEASPFNLELLFRYAISTHFYQFINQQDELITKCKSLEDAFGNPVFDDVKLEPVRMNDKEDLCQYLTKNLFHSELINDPSDDGAGLYKVSGDKLSRSL